MHQRRRSRAPRFAAVVSVVAAVASMSVVTVSVIAIIAAVSLVAVVAMITVVSLIPIMAVAVVSVITGITVIPVPLTDAIVCVIVTAAGSWRVRSHAAVVDGVARVRIRHAVTPAHGIVNLDTQHRRVDLVRVHAGCLSLCLRNKK